MKSNSSPSSSTCRGSGTMPGTSANSTGNRPRSRNSEVRKEQNRAASRVYREKRKQKLALLDQMLKSENQDLQIRVKSEETGDEINQSGHSISASGISSNGSDIVTTTVTTKMGSLSPQFTPACSYSSRSSSPGQEHTFSSRQASRSPGPITAPQPIQPAGTGMWTGYDSSLDLSSFPNLSDLDASDPEVKGMLDMSEVGTGAATTFGEGTEMGIGMDMGMGLGLGFPSPPLPGWWVDGGNQQRGPDQHTATWLKDMSTPYGSIAPSVEADHTDGFQGQNVPIITSATPSPGHNSLSSSPLPTFAFPATTSAATATATTTATTPPTHLTSKLHPWYFAGAPASQPTGSESLTTSSPTPTLRTSHLRTSSDTLDSPVNTALKNFDNLDPVQQERVWAAISQKRALGRGRSGTAPTRLAGEMSGMGLGAGGNNMFHSRSVSTGIPMITTTAMTNGDATLAWAP